MSKAEKYILAFWLVSNLVIGLLIVHDYGISYDEPEYYLYAQNTVDAYKSFFALAYTPVFGPHDLPNYGPAFTILPELTIRFLRFFSPNIGTADVWHFSCFVVFQLGGLCLHSLARRWFNRWSAWGILLLYTSQPLLWGHAFINPKDIPFMAFFLFTVWSGFRLADSLGARNFDLSFQPVKIRTFSLPHFTVKESLPFLRIPQLRVAGILLGMTMSMRLLGPLPGLIVILCLAFTLRDKWLSVTLAYLMCATVTMFLTWPYLWPHPIGHWMDSLVLMVKFPWPGHVLFNGTFYKPDHLPVSYLPTLLNIQLDEPLLILIYLGLPTMIIALFRGRVKLDLFLVIVIGALLPLMGFIVFRATLYDNFRQLLFLLPPLILLSGFALDIIFLRMKPTVLRFIFLLILALPGVYSIIELHPYQYIYYNSFLGKANEASQNFELDYWFTSYRETALWLNKRAPINAKIGGNGPTNLLYMYLRRDLVPKNNGEPNDPYDYFVAISRYHEDATLYPNAKIVYSIQRNGATLAVIKQLSP